MKILYTLLFIISMCHNSFAADFFVRPLGGDYGDEDGTSYDNAFDGSADIAWSGVTAGDTLYICGNHTEDIAIGINGNSSNQFTIRGDCVNETGIVNLTGSTDKCISGISGRSYIDIRNISLIGGSSNAIYLGYGTGGLTPTTKIRFFNVTFSGSTDAVALRYASTDGRIENCTFTSSPGGGLVTWSSPNVVVENVTVTSCGTASQNTDGIGIDNGSYNHTVINCTVTGNLGNAGIDVQDSTNGSEYIGRIENCYVSGGDDHGIQVSNAYTTYINNSISINNAQGNLMVHSSYPAIFQHCSAIGAGAYSLKVGNTVDVGIFNATINNCLFQDATTNIFLHNTSDTLTENNNLYDSDGNYQIYNGSATNTYNLTTWQGMGYSSDILTSDPLINSTGFPYTNSPAIDAGTDVGVTTDYRGVSRSSLYDGDLPDIGAYERKKKQPVYTGQSYSEWNGSISRYRDSQ